MNTTTTSHVAAAFAAALITLLLLAGVASLAGHPQPAGSVPIAFAQAVTAPR